MNNNTLSLREALLLYPQPEGRQWLRFLNPIETVIAWDIEDVVPAIKKAEAATQKGFWAVGMVSYDAGEAFDTAFVSHRDPDTPLVAFGIFDGPSEKESSGEGQFELAAWTPSVSQTHHEDGVDKVKEFIASGDTYQVNLTLRMHSEFNGDPKALFHSLARAQKGDHLAYLDFGSRAVCSASPELFFRKRGRTLISKPMKGTLPASVDPAELRASIKDQAENTMIVDMMRNDFGRIAEIGSVQVPILHEIETYPTVHQMVSEVRAETDASIAEVFSATFPAASITGAPKISTSRIITELESTPRGIYTGAIGAMAPDGGAEFNVAIRTVWLDTESGRAIYGTGGGIVWDSQPTAEWYEAITKTRVLDRAPRSFDLLETMLFVPEDGILLLERHLDRLADSAKFFAIDLDIAAIETMLKGIELDDPASLRLTVDVAGEPHLHITPLVETNHGPWLVPVHPDPVQTRDLFLSHKTTNRGVYDRAREAHPEAPDVILVNERGELTETSIGNLVLVLDGQLVTPPLSSGVLPGTMRADLVEHDKISERVLTKEDLKVAEEIFMINSVRGWVELLVAETNE